MRSLNFFDKDLPKLVDNYTSAHGTSELNSIDVDFDGRKIEMTLQGRDAEKEYEMILEPLKNELVKESGTRNRKFIEIVTGHEFF